ncbi:hypothetical protein STEG23_011709, partial [Scotinomys teguina]
PESKHNVSSQTSNHNKQDTVTVCEVLLTMNHNATNAMDSLLQMHTKPYKPLLVLQELLKRSGDEKTQFPQVPGFRLSSGYGFPGQRIRVISENEDSSKGQSLRGGSLMGGCDFRSTGCSRQRWGTQTGLSSGLQGSSETQRQDIGSCSLEINPAVKFSLPKLKPLFALRRLVDQGQNDKMKLHTAGLKVWFNKGYHQAPRKPGGAGRLSVKRTQMTVNPFLVLVPRDMRTDFVSKGEIYPREALAGSQSSPDSSENITVHTEDNIVLQFLNYRTPATEGKNEAPVSPSLRHTATYFPTQFLGTVPCAITGSKSENGECRKGLNTTSSLYTLMTGCSDIQKGC